MTGASFVAAVPRVTWTNFLVMVAVAAFAASPQIAFGAGKSDECLTGPKATAPSGERWYYRVDRGTKRHCWYTRAGGPRRTVLAVSRATVPDTIAPAPLHLSVANARAEADLSIQPPPASTPALPEIVSNGEATASAWTLAERWSSNQDAASFARPSSVPVNPAPLVRPPEPSEPDDASQDDLLEIAAGTVALLGLSMVLIAALRLRRRRRDRTNDSAEDRFLPIDLDDGLPIAWRAEPMDEPRTRYDAARQREVIMGRLRASSPTGFAVSRRTPTIPPAGRA
jgi:hypothetical protein